MNNVAEYLGRSQQTETGQFITIPVLVMSPDIACEMTSLIPYQCMDREAELNIRGVTI